MVCNFFHVYAHCSCFILCHRGQTCRLVPQKGGGNWLLREEKVRRRGFEGGKGRTGGGRVTWEGGCTKLEAATLPALTWGGTFKHGFPKRLLLFLHLSFKRPSSPVIASISASKVFQPTCRGDPWQRLVSISCWAGATFKERPLLPLPLPLLLLPGDSLSKN